MSACISIEKEFNIFLIKKIIKLNLSNQIIIDQGQERQEEWMEVDGTSKTNFRQRQLKLKTMFRRRNLSNRVIDNLQARFYSLSNAEIYELSNICAMLSSNLAKLC